MIIWEKLTAEDMSDQESDGENCLLIKEVVWRRNEEQMLINLLDERRASSSSRPCLPRKQGSPSKRIKSCVS